MGNIISKATAAILAEYQCYSQILIPYSTIVWVWYQRTKVLAQGEVWYQPVFPIAGKGTSMRCFSATVCFLHSSKFFILFYPFFSAWKHIFLHINQKGFGLFGAFISPTSDSSYRTIIIEPINKPQKNNTGNSSLYLFLCSLVIITALINFTQVREWKDTWISRSTDPWWRINKSHIKLNKQAFA